MLRNDIYLGVYRFHKSKHGKDVDGSRYVVRRKEQVIAGSQVSKRSRQERRLSEN